MCKVYLKNIICLLLLCTACFDTYIVILMVIKQFGDFSILLNYLFLRILDILMSSEFDVFTCYDDYNHKTAVRSSALLLRASVFRQYGLRSVHMYIHVCLSYNKAHSYFAWSDLLQFVLICYCESYHMTDIYHSFRCNCCVT